MRLLKEAVYFKMVCGEILLGVLMEFGGVCGLQWEK